MRGLFLTFIGVCILLIATPIALGAAYLYGTERARCELMQARYGVPVRISVGEGCMVRYQGEWMQADMAVLRESEK